MSKELESLASEADKMSKVSLYGLISVFLISLFIFLFAESISKLGSFADRSGEENRLESELEKLSEARFDNLRQITEMKEQFDNDIPWHQAGHFKVYEEISTELNVKYKNKLEELEKLRTFRLEELNAKNNPSVDRSIATAITRVGAVMLSIFMMQIMLSFYRYFLKLSNYYKARILAFNYADDEEERSNVIKSVSTEHITFGKEPQPGLEKIVEIAKLMK